MLFRKGLILVFIVGLFSAAIVDARPYPDPFGVSTIRLCSNPGVENDHRHFLDALIAGGGDHGHKKTGLIAQTAASGDEQNKQTPENMSGTRERLEARIRALEAEWAAIKKEEEEIDRIDRGGTLRGSKAKKFMKRTEAFNQRVMKYNADKEKLRQDIEAYETLVKAKETAVQENVQETVPPKPAPE